MHFAQTDRDHTHGNKDETAAKKEKWNKFSQHQSMEYGKKKEKLSNWYSSQ